MIKRNVWLVAVNLLLAGCGGGGGGGGSSSVSIPSSNSVSFSPASAVIGVNNLNTQTTRNVTATYKGATTSAMVINLAYDTSVFSSVVGTVGADQTYNFALKTQSGLPYGEYKGNIEYKLCSDAACTSVVVSGSYPYDVTVSPVIKYPTFSNGKLGDWSTYKGNPSHTAYVPGSFNPLYFTKVWEYNSDIPSEFPSSGVVSQYRLDGMVTDDDSIYATVYSYLTIKRLYKLGEKSGSKVWSSDVSSTNSQSTKLSYANGQIYVPVKSESGVNDGNVLSINSSDGALLRSYPFITQSTSYGAPAVVGGKLYFAAGYVGNRVYSYDIASGSTNWDQNWKGNLFGVMGETVAADTQHVFFSDGNALNIINPVDGSVDRSVPFAASGELNGAPMIGGSGNVLISTSLRHDSEGLIESFDTKTGALSWKSAKSYYDVGALAKGVIYAPRRGGLDALSEANGNVLWSWDLPVDERYFIRSVVATNNLIFISTNDQTYAIDLDQHVLVWKYPAGGSLAISSNGTLYIGTDPVNYSDPSKITAIKLQ